MLRTKWFLLPTLALALLLVSPPAWAQFAGQLSSVAVNGVGIPNVNIWCSDATDHATPCSFGGGGGAVTQSGTWQVNLGYGGNVVSGANPLGISDLALDALISGGKLPVSGTFWQATQPVSETTLDGTISGGKVAISSTAGNSVGTTGSTAFTIQGAPTGVAVPISAAALPLPTGASSSSVNQPGYLQAVSSGGASSGSYVNAAASCMATNVKSTSGHIYSYSVSNSNATAVWFRIFASGSAPTCGSGTPVRRVFVPPTSTIAFDDAEGIFVSNGIGFDVTSGSGADTDSATVTTASTVLVNVDYK